MMTNDDERGPGGRGVKNAQNLMTSYVNNPLPVSIISIVGESSSAIMLITLCSSFLFNSA